MKQQSFLRDNQGDFSGFRAEAEIGAVWIIIFVGGIIQQDFHEIGHNETQRDAIEHNILGAFHNGNQPDTIPVWV